MNQTTPNPPGSNPADANPAGASNPAGPAASVVRPPAPRETFDDAAAIDRRNRRLLRVVVVWVPLAIIAIGTAVLVSWLPRLPDELITHWGADGPDGYMPPLGFLVFYVGISLIVSGVLALTVYSGAGAGAGGRTADAAGRRATGYARPTAVFAPAVATSLTLIMLALTGLQLDGGAPSDAAVILIVLGGLLFGAAVGFLAWILLPDSEHAPTPDATPALELAPGETAVWTSTARAPWPVWALAGVIVLACAVPVVLSPETGWVIGIVLLIAVLALASTAAVRVTIDGGGLSARTALGFRVAHVPLDEVVSAAAVQLSAGEFGGWGFRWDATGRRGVIIRSGSAIEVARRNSPPLVITVADAATGAALLNGLVARASK